MRTGAPPSRRPGKAAMARLKCHGQELGRVTYLSTIVTVMSDGTLLSNDGHGWKLYRKCKPGVTSEQVLKGRHCRSLTNGRKARSVGSEIASLTELHPKVKPRRGVASQVRGVCCTLARNQRPQNRLNRMPMLALSGDGAGKATMNVAQIPAKAAFQP